MSKKLLLAFYFLLSTFYLTNAQSSWQWGKRGGSSSFGSGGPDETVVDMATDTHGNIYVLSMVMQTGLNVDGHAITGWGNHDVLISSFKCDGTYRWSKIIGSNNDDYGVALKTDTLGGVYVTGSLYTDFVTDHIDTDTSWVSPSTSFKFLFLLKYDTAGNYKWFRMPEPDTVSIFGPGNTGAADMDVDPGGNVYLLCVLDPGAYAGGSYVVTTTGLYMLKYDKNGNFISGNPMQITGINNGFKMKRDFINSKYYITVFLNGTLSFGGTPINHPMCIGSFNNSGIFLWQRQDTDPPSYGSSFGRPCIDGSHNIYLGGRSSPSDTFNTYAIINGGTGTLPLAFKLDTNGNNIFAKNATVNAATFCSTIILNGGEVDISGQYPGKLKWTGYSDSLHKGVAGYDIFITRFNATTGAVIGIDSLASPAGTNDDATAMTSDKYGNFYVGGDFASSITVNGTTLSSAGGGSDFFVAKYGTSNCSSPISLETTSPDLSKGDEILRVYPNPATEELNITGIMQRTTYRLLNITGVTIQQGTFQTGANAIQMRNCASGLYILEMNGVDGARNIVKVMKQ